MPGILRYWETVAVRAFTEAWTILFPNLKAFAVGVAVYIVYAALLWLLADPLGATAKLSGQAILWLVPFLILPVVFISKLVSVPAKMDAQARSELERFAPKLQLSLADGRLGVGIDYGTVSETFSGKRYAVATSAEHMLRLSCTNLSALRVEDCQAFIEAVMAVRDDGATEGIGFTEPVQLLWSRDVAANEFSVSIQPNARRYLHVLVRRANPCLMLFRRTQELPFEYGILFHEKRKYRMWIQANAPNAQPSRICLDVWPVEATNSIGIAVETVEEPASVRPSL